MYKVYLLDDEPFILEGLKYIVDWQNYGFEIVGFANNGEDGLKEILSMDIDLVITDSQAFKEVDKIVPKEINLTSFSILFARQKGELSDFLEGSNKLKNLKPGNKILICESCTHNVSHEDIGRVQLSHINIDRKSTRLNSSH